MKLVEKVVQNQLVEYLETNHLLADSQHGYRRHLSTESALHVITDRVYRAMDCGDISIIVLLDLSKMFDVIPHENLLRKLSLYGIDSRWFRDYLEGHTQRVQLKMANGAVMKSSWKNNNMGIFQGGSLSCALCLLFTNDISLYVDSDVTITQYADDTSILITGKKREIQNLIRRMESILNTLFQWFCANGMKINTGKTQMMVLGTHAMLRTLPTVTLKFGDATISDSRVVKSLGVMLDRHLSFEQHVNSVGTAKMHRPPDGPGTRTSRSACTSHAQTRAVSGSLSRPILPLYLWLLQRHPDPKNPKDHQFLRKSS